MGTVVPVPFCPFLYPPKSYLTPVISYDYKRIAVPLAGVGPSPTSLLGGNHTALFLALRAVVGPTSSRLTFLVQPACVRSGPTG